MWPAVAMVVAAGATTVALAQAPAVQPHDHPAAPAAPAGCGMMAHQKEMAAAMAAADLKLNELVARMNSAKGDAKVEAIAAVVTEIARQRSEMTKMQTGMTEQMKSHMSGMHAARHPEK
jgi:hypothetical protein